RRREGCTNVPVPIKKGSPLRHVATCCKFSPELVVPGKACREASWRKSSGLRSAALYRAKALAPNAEESFARCRDLLAARGGRHISTVTSVIRSKEPGRPAGTARQMLLHAGRRGGLPRVTRERESERKTVTVTVTPDIAGRLSPEKGRNEG
ncbi:Uncharacterized protein DBV15_08171, partial [Temnothorax longispinosus]